MINEVHLHEWVNRSGVSEPITRLNVKTIEDSRELDKALNRNTDRRWKHSDNLVPGWLVTGVDPETGERTYQGCQYKPDTPQPKRNDNGDPIPGKAIKYLSASASPVEPLFLDCGVDGYWQQVLSDSQRPIVITEGAKKAGAILTKRTAAISLPGVSTGQKLGRLKANLKQFCAVGRTIYLAFDSDLLTKSEVRTALDKLGKLIAAQGAVVHILTWEPSEGKGIDDYFLAGGDLADLIGQSLTLEEWRSAAPKQDSKDEKRNCADQLIDLATAANVTLWHTPDDEAFADVLDGKVRQTLPIRRKAFRQWLSRQYYNQERRSLSADALQQAIITLESFAVYDGEERQASLRVAEHDDRLYLDMGTPDWQAIEVSPDGWRMVTDAPIRFRREIQHPYPVPASGGNLDALQQLVGIDGEAWLLFLTYILNCFKPQGSYPIMILHGEAGAGKSTKSRVIRKLVDPGDGDLLTPRNLQDARNLAISATKRHLLVFDNLSGVSADQSDDLCRLATGGSFTHRALQTDSEEITFSFVKPVVLNGIDSIATRGDLLDRAVLLPLKRPEKRRSEDEFWAEFERIHAQTFGALLDLLSQILGILPTVELPDDCPRMTGYTRMGIATEQALGLEPGTFLAAYRGVREDACETVIEASPIAQAILDLMSDRTAWEGYTKELLSILNTRTDEGTRKSKLWAPDPTRLGKQLSRLAPDLRAVGVEYVRKPGTNRGTYITLTTISGASTPDSGASKNTSSTVEPAPCADSDASGASGARKQSHSERRSKQLQVGDRVQYVGTNPHYQNQYLGILRIRTITPGGIACVTESGNITTWLPKEDLEVEER